MSITKIIALKEDAKTNEYASISTIMRWHINGEVPIDIFKHRRPLESKSEFALEYRKANHEPVTKSPFDKAIGAINEITKNANISISGLQEKVDINQIIHFGKLTFNITDFFKNHLTRLRELDPNAMIVIAKLPTIEHSYNYTLNDFDTELKVMLISSPDIISINNDVLICNIGEWEYKKGKYEKLRLIINSKQTAISIPTLIENKIEYVDVPIEETYLNTSPFFYISDNISNKIIYTDVSKENMIIRYPYFWGAASWGNKFYGEDTDFNIKMTRFTYPHTTKAILSCNEIGMEYINGVHCEVDTKKPCPKCNGTGKFIAEESPLGATYIDYSKYADENGNYPPIIDFKEPGTAGLTMTNNKLQDYYDNMCSELGLMQQNVTNQSGVAKSYDENTRISTYSQIVYNNIKVFSNILNIIQQYIYNTIDNEVVDIEVNIIGELNIRTNKQLIAELSEIRSNGAPPSIQSAIIKKILLKQLGDTQQNRRIIDLASRYDILFRYSDSDLTQAKAQLGSQYVNEQTIIIHNTIIDVISDILKVEDLENEEVINKLDDYYSRYKTNVSI